jgi:hypothetical protein
MHVTELVVGAVALWVGGGFTATVGFATDVVLPGQTAWTHFPQREQLPFGLLNLFFELLKA